MIVAIHQPHFLPWLGYLARMQQADLFIVLDHVQFERRNYQNRTRFLLEGQAQWLTVPVLQRSQKETLVEKQVDLQPDMGERWWGPRHLQTLRHAYRDAPHFGEHAAGLKALFTHRWQRLADLDQATLDYLRDALDIRTPLVTSSSLAAPGAKADLILNLCKAVGARTYLAGLGGSRGYLQPEPFAEAGIGLAFQSFTHPVHAQCGGAAQFVPGLSALDVLFNCGAATAAALLRSAGGMPSLCGSRPAQASGQAGMHGAMAMTMTGAAATTGVDSAA